MNTRGFSSLARANGLTPWLSGKWSDVQLLVFHEVLPIRSWEGERFFGCIGRGEVNHSKVIVPLIWESTDSSVTRMRTAPLFRGIWCIPGMEVWALSLFVRFAPFSRDNNHRKMIWETRGFGPFYNLETGQLEGATLYFAGSLQAWRSIAVV